MLPISGGAARAETYTELFIGGVHTENEHIPFSLLHRYPNGVSAENCAVPGRIHLAINQSGTAGARLGTWFAREGFPGLDYPQWMRYFGCYMDFSYHRLDYRPQKLDTVSIDNTPPVFGMKAVPNDKHTNRFLSEARCLYYCLHGQRPVWLLPHRPGALRAFAALHRPGAGDFYHGPGSHRPDHELPGGNPHVQQVVQHLPPVEHFGVPGPGGGRGRALDV